MQERITALQGTRCAIPTCRQPWVDLAHIAASGMGGRKSTYTEDNLVGMCRPCHDIYDGRDLKGRQAMLRDLLLYVVRMERGRF